LKTGLAGTCALGFLFSFGWTPCTGPLLAALLGLSARQGNALDGGTLLLVYSLGLGLPFLLIALASQQILQRIRRISRFFPALQKMGGLLFVIMGGWMLYIQAERVFLAWQDFR
jgi:cytochrome c-type biogenesis protein/peptide methionine sulfoxide reductase msrA/msrB